MEKETLQSALAEFPQVPTVNINNVKTFLAVMADGSIQQMSKSDMASVLGGLLGLNTSGKIGGVHVKDFVKSGNKLIKLYTFPSGTDGQRVIIDVKVISGYTLLQCCIAIQNSVIRTIYNKSAGSDIFSIIFKNDNLYLQINSTTSGTTIIARDNWNKYVLEMCDDDISNPQYSETI